MIKVYLKSLSGDVIKTEYFNDVSEIIKKYYRPERLRWDDSFKIITEDHFLDLQKYGETYISPHDNVTGYVLKLEVIK